MELKKNKTLEWEQEDALKFVLKLEIWSLVLQQKV